MRYEEERLAAAIEELKAFSANIAHQDSRADLALIIAGFQTMRPYVSVGLKVSPSCETVEAINRLQEHNVLTHQLWISLKSAIEAARKPNLVIPIHQAVRKPRRQVMPRSFGRSLAHSANRKNRWV